MGLGAYLYEQNYPTFQPVDALNISLGIGGCFYLLIRFLLFLVQLALDNRKRNFYD